jgi:hypothetical protein
MEIYVEPQTIYRTKNDNITRQRSAVDSGIEHLKTHSITGKIQKHGGIIREKT